MISIKEIAKSWLIIGTSFVIYSSIYTFELSATYFFSSIILWLIVVGIPYLVLLKLNRGKMLKESSQSSPKEGIQESNLKEEKKDPPKYDEG